MEAVKLIKDHGERQYAVHPNGLRVGFDKKPAPKGPFVGPNRGGRPAVGQAPDQQEKGPSEPDDR